MHPGRARLALPPITLVALAELALATRAADPLLPACPRPRSIEPREIVVHRNGVVQWTTSVHTADRCPTV